MTSAKLIDRVLSHILGKERSLGCYYVWRSKRNQAITRDAPLGRDSTFHNDMEPFRFIYECEEISSCTDPHRFPFLESFQQALRSDG